MATTATSRKSLRVSSIPTAQQVAEARKLAREYKYTVWPEDGECWSRCVELPHCLGDGKDVESAIEAARETVVAGLAADLAAGMPAPHPAREGVRSEQVNVRLSADERATIEANAQRAGFKGMADYIRIMALGSVHIAR